MPNSRTAQFEAVEACLQRARTELAASGPALARMRIELDKPATENTCRSMDPGAPFKAFEGRWSGRWGDMPVEHLWRTVEPGVQLVVIKDGDVHKVGINLHDGRQICGIVVEADGQERLHTGRFISGETMDEAHLEWRAGDHVYRERVTCADDRRQYEIEEWVRTQDAYEPGVRTQYTAPMPSSIQLAGRLP